ncbi:MAG: hypothetical protein J5525_12445 [Lachnospiraceae bacterium]|nr:hypothetical protein [Lachnospiraceae bacterium]
MKYRTNIGRTGYINYDMIDDIQNNSTPMSKCRGGLWLSNIDAPKDSTSWEGWCEYEMPHWLSKEETYISTKEDSKVLKIDSNIAVLQVINKYYDKEQKYIDYEKIAKDYDAIDFQLSKTSIDPSRSMFGPLDCDSVVLLNKDTITHIQNPNTLTPLYENERNNFNPKNTERPQDKGIYQDLEKRQAQDWERSEPLVEAADKARVNKVIDSVAKERGISRKQIIEQILEAVTSKRYTEKEDIEPRLSSRLDSSSIRNDDDAR